MRVAAAACAAYPGYTEICDSLTNHSLLEILFVRFTKVNMQPDTYPIGHLTIYALQKNQAEFLTLQVAHMMTKDISKCEESF